MPRPGPLREPASTADRAPLSLYLALFALALAPTLAVPIPAMADYPNHLARMYLLAREGPHPHYAVAFTPVPNLAMDLLVPALARLTGVETAARLFVLASQGLLVTGACALEWAVKRRLHAAPLLALLALPSVPFAWGFTNFAFGLGLALWGMAAWIGLPARRRVLRAGLHALVSLACFAAHLFSLGLYGAVLGLHEVWRLAVGRATAAGFLGRCVLLAAPTAVLAGLMAGAGGAVGQAGTTWQGATKPFWVVAILDGYDLRVALACGAALIALAYWLARRGMLRLVAAGPVVAGGLGLLYVAMPGTLLDTAFVDLRIVAAAVLVLPAFLVARFPTPALRRGVVATLAGLVLVNLATAGATWWSYRRDYADLIASFALVERGARLLVGHSGAGQDPPLADLAQYPIYNAPTLAVHYADAFVPTLFTAPGKQPITVRPESRGLAVPYGGPVPMAELRAAAGGSPPPGIPDYARAWTRDFAYLYVVGPQDGNPMPERLEALAASRRFGLYRIRRDP